MFEFDNYSMDFPLFEFTFKQQQGVVMIGILYQLEDSNCICRRF